MNAIILEIGTVEQYEVINCRRSTRWFVLSVLKKLKYIIDPSECGYLHIPWNLSITKNIN